MTLIYQYDINNNYVMSNCQSKAEQQHQYAVTIFLFFSTVTLQQKDLFNYISLVY